MLRNDTGVVWLASLGDGSPCGHCRQWLNEFVNGSQLQIIGAQTEATRTLEQLFPSGFGPDALGNECPLLSHGAACHGAADGAGRRPVSHGQRAAAPELWAAGVEASLHGHGPGDASADNRTLLQLARLRAERSYAPYTTSRSGVALLVDGGAAAGPVYASGGVLESVAFDPTVDPLQVALIDMITMGHSNYSSIVAAALVERRGSVVSYRSRTEALLASIAPGAQLQYAQF